jgi:hypothetical protein
MCKQDGRTFCSELGHDVALWSKDCPLPKPDWIIESLNVFKTASEFASVGKIEEARLTLLESADHELRTWFDVHAQNSGGWRFKAFNIPGLNATTPLDPIKKFSEFEPSIFERDKFRCQYCASTLFPKKVFKSLQAVVGDQALPLGRTNQTRSGFYLMFVATLDHVLPWSLGGRTDETNLVTCCWSCNYGKANYTVEQLGMTSPFQRT